MPCKNCGSIALRMLGKTPTCEKCISVIKEERKRANMIRKLNAMKKKERIQFIARQIDEIERKKHNNHRSWRTMRIAGFSFK